VHTKPIETVHTRGGLKREGNVDFRLAFLAGMLVSRSSSEVVVLASGDGALVNDVAAGIQALRRDREVWTLSLAGSTSFRLDAERNPLICGNMEIGLDVLWPIRLRRRDGLWKIK
jgi:hypothetical protein